MTFLHPWFLAALAAAAVPLLLHIIQTRRIRKVSFSTLYFLKLIHRQRSMRIRISRLLLLLARIGLAVLVVLAFAQPYFTASALAFLSAGPQVVGILWDNSAATGATDGATPVLERARRRLAQFVTTLDEKDALVVVCTSPIPKLIYRGEVAEFSPKVLPGTTAAGADRVRALAVLREALKDQPGTVNLALFSDFRKAVWPTGMEKEKDRENSKILVFPTHLETYANWSISRVHLHPSAVAVGEPAVASITLNYSTSGAQKNTTMFISINDKLVDQRTMVAASGPINLDLALPKLKEGNYRLGLRLSPDSLGIDDKQEAPFRVLPYRRVLLVNGKKRATPSLDEGYFLRKVLGTVKEPRRGLLCREVTELTPAEDLRDVQLVILANVQHLVGQAKERLSQYVQTGGTLLTFLGDQVTAADYNASVLGWVGYRLDRRVDTTTQLKLGEGSTSAFESLYDESLWRHINLDRYYLLQKTNSAEAGVSPVLTADGAPAVLVGKHGHGTVVVVNASAGTEASDLPMHPVFPVMVNEATRLATSSPLDRYEVGTRLALPLTASEVDALLTVQTPDGRIVGLKPSRGKSGLVAIFDDAALPGVYNFIRRSPNDTVMTPFVVATDGRESDLTPLTAAELASRFPGATVVGGDAGAADRHGRSTVSVVELLLYLAAAFCLIELFLVWEIERWIRTGSPEISTEHV